MSTTFTFEFQDEDIDQNSDNSESLVAQGHDQPSNETSFVLPRLHTLEEILSTFPSQLSFSTIPIRSDTNHGVDIPRRDLYDVRAQLMAEDGQPSEDSVLGLSNDDIVPNIYEGGFKTWECSVDLSNYIWSCIDVFDKEPRKDYSIVELGAGTALPSITFTRKWLSERSKHPKDSSRLQLCLADYNRSVLDLVTIPNLYLSTYFFDKDIDSGEIDTESEALRQFESDLSNFNIDVAAISGSWSPELADAISSVEHAYSETPRETIILASETIYSPASIHSFTKTMLIVMSKAKSQGSNVKALIAAKRVYFGVGGGIDEFMKELANLGGRGRIVWETQSSGVGRVIIEVTIS